MGIFDRGSAVAMVASSAVAGFDRSSSGTGTATIAPSVSKENLKSAMQWDLWNPWATFYELNSTHPLVAHRLQYLGDQAAAMGQEPYVVFDRRKPESYWDDFAVDLLVMFLPLLLFLLGLGLAVGLGGAAAFGILPGVGILGPKAMLVLFGLPLVGLGIGMLAKTLLVYRGDHFAPLAVAGLLHKVKVSNVRPVPARLQGHDHRQGRPRLDLVRRLRDARRDGDPLPGLPPAPPDLGVALRALPRRRIRGQTGRGGRLVPARTLALPGAQVDHRRRRDAQQLRPPRAVRLGRLGGVGRCGPGCRRAPGWLMSAPSTRSGSTASLLWVARSVRSDESRLSPVRCGDSVEKRYRIPFLRLIPAPGAGTA